MRKFGAFKQGLIDYLCENYQTDKFADSFKEIYRLINESKDFKEVFLLYSLIEETSFPDDKESAELFLNEALDKIEEHGRKSGAVSVMKKLGEYFGKQHSSNPIYEAIDMLVYSNRSIDLKNRVNAKKTLLKHLQREVSNLEFKPVNENVLLTLMVSEYNKNYQHITEDQKKKLSEYLSLTPSLLEENVKTKKENIISILEENLKNEEDEQLMETINETIRQVQTMEPSKFNLYKLETLLQDLS